MRILFDSKLNQYKTPFGVLTPDEVCAIRIRIPVSCCTRQVELRLLRENETPLCEVALRLASHDADYETYEGTFSLEQTGLYFYYFAITTENESFRLFKQGNDTNMEAGDLWQVSCVDTRFPVPRAMQGAVMYQILPDRFFAEGVCDCLEKIQPYWVHENRDDVPVYLPDENGEILNNDFFGGNLRGIIEKLPYLHGQGIEILYLNPIFMAWSTHRYDTFDYKRIDPMLGTEEDFAELCEKAHELGMKVVLDGVFSHVGSRSPYFQNALHDENSPYRKWFTFQSFPDKYTCWWDIKTLPCVNKLEPSYLDYIIRDDDSVAAKWLRLGADGFRLDVVDELPDAFVLCLRERMREIDPEAILIGEVWEDASNKIAYGVRRRYFADAELDSVMNYPWRNAILNYLRGEDDGTAFGECIMTLAENYPPDVLNAVMDILSTHDTPRILTTLVDPFDGDRAELAERSLDEPTLRRAKKLLCMAAFLQFTLPGMPCVYYGDEAGMEGYRDPFNRKFYPWGREDRNLQSFYRELALCKRNSAPLRLGTVTVTHCGAGRLCFERRLEGKTVRVFCNRGTEPWTIKKEGTVLLGGGIEQQLSKTLSLGEYGYCAIEL